MLTIGQRIRIRREELDLSQEELANRSGYKSKSSINKIEMDQRNLSQSKIKAIADALETTPSYIMGWEEEDKIEDSLSKVKAALEDEDGGKAELIELVLGLPEDCQREALNYLRYLSAKRDNS